VNCVVIYASRSGNTAKVAEAIAGGLRPRGSIQLLSVDEAQAVFSDGFDLLVVGGPTEAHGMTEPMTRFFDQLASGSLQGKAAAAFDTRLHWPHWLSGSAASGIAERLTESGAHVIAGPESFIVSRKPLLEPGELERAAAWGASLADKAETNVQLVS